MPVGELGTGAGLVVIQYHYPSIINQYNHHYTVNLRVPVGEPGAGAGLVVRDRETRDCTWSS